MKMAWFFEELFDEIRYNVKVLEKGKKTLVEVLELINVGGHAPSASREKTVIAATDDINMKDVTPGETSPKGKGGNSADGQVIDTELDSTGCYVPKKERLVSKL